MQRGGSAAGATHQGGFHGTPAAITQHASEPECVQMKLLCDLVLQRTGQECTQKRLANLHSNQHGRTVTVTEVSLLACTYLVL
jgi:hypothetical protein